MNGLVFVRFKIYFGGIAPDDKKVDAVKNARRLQNAAEVPSFLGQVNYCAYFTPNLCNLAEPLQKLTKSNTEWVCGKPQQDAFEGLHVLLTSDCVVTHYDQLAASPAGVVAISLTAKQGQCLSFLTLWCLISHGSKCTLSHPYKSYPRTMLFRSRMIMKWMYMVWTLHMHWIRSYGHLFVSDMHQCTWMTFNCEQPELNRTLWKSELDILQV